MKPALFYIQSFWNREVVTESIATFFVAVNVGIEKGAKQEREKADAEYAARDSRREDYLRSQNISEDVIAAMRAIQ